MTDEINKKLNAYAALVKSQEGQISALRRARQAGVEAVNTLQSERLANMKTGLSAPATHMPCNTKAKHLPLRNGISGQKHEGRASQAHRRRHAGRWPQA
jgi:hypothetical protein